MSDLSPPAAVPRAARPRSAARRAAVPFLPAGLVWLGFSVYAGVNAGREADLHRRWVVCQYVLRGVDPYPAARAALERKYGPLGGGRAKPRVYAVPRLDPGDAAADPRPAVAAAAPLLDSPGPPEAVYPPSTDLLLAATLGRLPEGWVHPAGVLANLALLAGCVALLRKPPAGSAAPAAVTLALVLLWSPVQDTVRTGQFALLVTACVLLAYRWLDRHEYLAGALLALALVKPTVALPFLILPAVRGRWRALAAAAGLHLAATAVQSARFGVPPGELLREWLGVASYFTQGQYTLQEVLTALRLADTPAGLAAVGGSGLLALAWCRRYRAAGDADLTDLLCFVSVLWTYHGPYDFVVLLVPLLRRVCWPSGVSGPAWALATFACLSLATGGLVYADEGHAASWAVRLAARVLLVWWCVALALRVRRAARPAPAAVAAATSGWEAAASGAMLSADGESGAMLSRPGMPRRNNVPARPRKHAAPQ